MFLLNNAGENMQLTEIVEHYNRIASAYETEGYYSKQPLNAFWGDVNMRTMRSLIASAKTKLDIIHGAQQTFMFSVNVSDESNEYAVDWLLAEQSQREIDLFSLNPLIQESQYSYRSNNVVRNDRLLNPDFLRTVNISLEIDKYVRQREGKSISVGADRDFTVTRKDDERLNIIELGAGLGHLARTLKLFGIAGRHVIIDLPETLVFSCCFLTENFPDARVLLVSGAETGDEKYSEYDFVLVPTMYADRVLKEKYDLFINTASMGEMRNTDIRHWMDFIQNKLNVRYLFTLNRYLNTVNPAIHGWRYQENECSVHYDRQWKVLKWELEPSFTRSPYVDTLIARYVEIIAERLGVVDEVACVMRGRTIIERVKLQDWYRLHDIYTPVMTAGSNILVHDMTMTGTLFMLWDAMRLNPTVEAVTMLLKYMATLLRYDDVEFEEVNYYEDLVFKLYDPVRDSDLLLFAETLRARRIKREITDASSRQYNPWGVELVEESFNGYNLVRVNNRFVAVSKAIGKTDLMMERLGERDLPPLLLTGDSLESVKSKLSTPIKS